MIEDVVSALQQGKFEGRSQEVTKFFSAELESDNPKTTKKLCLYALKTIYIYATHFEKLPPAEIAGVSGAVEACCRFIQTNSKTETDSQTAEKSLYHVLNNALKKSHVPEGVSLSKCLKTFLYVEGRQDDATVHNIGRYAYVALWNAVNNLEKDPASDPYLCLQLYREALTHLLLSNKPAEKVEDLVAWTITHYRRVFAKMTLDKKAMKKACEALDALVQELSGLIRHRMKGKLSSEEEAAHHVMSLEMHLHLLNFLLATGGQALCPAVVDRLMSIMNSNTATHSKDVLTSLQPALTDITEAGVYLSAFTANAIVEGNTRCSESQLIRAAEKANTQLKAVTEKLQSVQQVRLLHGVVRFSLQLPDYETASGGRRFDYAAMGSESVTEVLNSYTAASQFYAAAAQTTSGPGDVALLDVVHFSHFKVLQYKLEAIVGELDGVKDSDKLTTWLPLVAADLSQLETVIGARQDGASKKQVVMEDLQQLANFSYKFGRLCFHCGLHAEAADFLKRSIAQYQKMLRGAESGPTAKVNLWRKYEMLAECYRRSGLFETALTTVAEGVLVEPDHLGHALDLWVRTKVELARSNADKLNTRSLWSVLETRKPTSGPRKGPTPLSQLQVLKAELNTYKKSRSRHADLVLPLVEELLAVCPAQSVDRADPLLEKVALLWTSRKEADTPALACCEEAIKILEGEPTNQKAQRPALLNDLARAYLWHHVITNVDPVQVRKEIKDGKSAAGEKSDVASKGDAEDREAYHACCTLDMEQQAVKAADRALQLWEQVVGFASVPDCFEKPYMMTTLHCVSALVDYYRLTHRIGEELRSLLVLTRLCGPTTYPVQYLRTQTDLIRAYNRLHQPQLALPLVDALTEWLQTAETCLTTPQHVSALLAGATTLLLNGQVNQSCEMLHKAMKIKSEHFKPKSTDALTLDASICPLAATLASMPAGYHESNHGDCCLGADLEDVLELEVKGTRSISGVVCFMMGEWLVNWKVTSDKVPLNTLSKWGLLDELLCSLLSTGATYVQLGEAQEAKCYLQQGLKLAQAFQLPRRFAEFHLELSQLGNISNKFTDSQSHINVASYTLNSTDPAPRPSDPASLTPKRKKPTKKRPSLQEDDSDDDMIIKTKPIEIPEVLEEDEASPNVIGSPTARRWKPNPPVQWSHPEDCECARCFDVTGQGLQLKHLVQQAYCLYQQGLDAQAEAFWNLLLENFDMVNNRLRHNLLKLLGPTANDGKKKNNDSRCEKKEVKKPLKSRGKKSEQLVIYEDALDQQFTGEPPVVHPSMFQKMLVEVCKHLAEQAINQQNWELYEQWVSKAEELLGPENYPWMTYCHTSLVENLYLKTVPALRLPTVVQKTDLEELCDRIGRVKIPKLMLEESDTPTEPKLPEPETNTKMQRKPSQSQLTKNSSTKKATVKTGDRTTVSSRKSSERNNDNKDFSHGEGATQDSIDSPSLSKALYKTPAKKIRSTSRSLINSAAPSTAAGKEKGLDKEYLPMFRTPKSVSGRRAMLDILINSGSDEDILKSTKSSIRKTRPATAKADASAKRASQRKAKSAADECKLTTPSVKMDVSSPAKGTKANNSLRSSKDMHLLSDANRTPMKGKSPVSFLFKAALNRSVSMEMGSENVFDFIPSSPEETPVAARGKKKPARPGRKPAAARSRKVKPGAEAQDIEVKREIDQPAGSAVVTAENVVEEKNNKTPSLGKSRVPLRPKLTRSKTAILEQQREVEFEGESTLLQIDCSQYIPEEDSSCDESREYETSPEHTPHKGEQHKDSQTEPCHPFLVPHESPREVMRHSRGSSLHYQPAFETVQEDAEEEVFSSSGPAEDCGIPAEWLEEPVETPRGDLEEDKGKSRKPSRSKLLPKRTAGRKAQGDVVTEVPRRSRLAQSALSSEDITKNRLKDVDENAHRPEPAPCNPTDDFADLDRAFNLCRHRPTPILYRKVCHAQALVQLAAARPDPWTLALYLTEAQSVTFRHNVLANICHKTRKLREDSESGEDSSATLRRLADMRAALRFGQDESHLRNAINTLPNDWTVVHLSVLTLVGQPCGRLVVTRFVAGEDPVTQHLPGFATNQGQKLLTEFAAILKSNNATMSLTNKSEWWSQRLALNEKLKEVLDAVEGRWLGAWLGLFLGRPNNDEDADRLHHMTRQLTTYLQSHVKTTICTGRVKALLQAHHLLEERHIAQCICEICDLTPDDDLLTELLAKTGGFAKSLNLEVSPQCRPVLLVLDREVQHLPWESLPCLRGQPVTRLPSVHFLHAHLGTQRADSESVFNRGVDQKNTFYVLNPDDNLDSTQATFEARFKSEPGWKGIVGKPPTSAEFTEGVTQHDMFIYCGHGSGSKFLPGCSLAALRCRAAVVLMGCSSGRLAVDGQLEAAGVMLNYFLAGCPCLVACLWDVTDRDIDRYLQDLLGCWQQAEPGTSLLHGVHRSRDVCRLPYLIGAAPAVYGLPVCVKGASG